MESDFLVQYVVDPTLLSPGDLVSRLDEMKGEDWTVRILRADLESKVKRKSAGALEVIQQSQFNEVSFRSNGLEAILTNSPCSQSWFPISSRVGRLGQHWRARLRFAGMQETVAWNELKRYPVFLTIAGPRSLLDAASTAPEACRFPLPTPGGMIFGTYDVLLPGRWVPRVSEVLGSWPKAFDFLGQVLDREHDVVLLSPKFGASQDESPGTGCRPRRHPLLVSSENRELWNSLVLKPSVDLAPRRCRPELGEFSLGDGRRLFSRQRRAALQELGLVFDRGDEEDWVPIIDKSHCEAVGLTPSRVPEVLSQPRAIDKLHNRASERLTGEYLRRSGRSGLVSVYAELLRSPEFRSLQLHQLDVGEAICFASAGLPR